VLVVRHLDPRVLASGQPGLDADDVRYLVMHRPSGALGGLREVVLAAGTSEVEHGLGGAREGFDEVAEPMRSWLIWRHAASLLRLWA
jgi:hypothetical protein